MTPEPDLSELQARVIADASEVFERLAAEIGVDDPGIESDVADPVGGQQLRAAGARLIDLFAGLFQEGVEAYLELAGAIVRAPVSGVPAGSPGGLAMRGAPGERATTTVWIHSLPTERDRVLTPTLTDLQAAGGERLDGTLARFLPATLHVPSGCSASSILMFAIPEQTRAGTYFGHVLAGGDPDGAAAGLPLELVVERARA